MFSPEYLIDRAGDEPKVDPEFDGTPSRRKLSPAEERYVKECFDRAFGGQR